MMMEMMWKPRTCDIKDERRMLDNLDGQTDEGDDDKKDDDEDEDDDEHAREI